MSNSSSPTLNLYELLKEDATKPPKGPKTDTSKTVGKKLTPSEKQRIRQEEEAEKLKASEQKKMDEALVTKHHEESIAQGFMVKETANSPNKANNKLSRSEWEAKKAKGEPLTDNPKEVHQKKQFEKNENQHQPNTRGPKPGRELDRHSQSTTGRKPETKRQGGGKYNVGKDTQVDYQDTQHPNWPEQQEEDVQPSTGTRNTGGQTSPLVTTTDQTQTQQATQASTVDNGKDQKTTVDTTSTTTTTATATAKATDDTKPAEDDDDGQKTMADYEKQRAVDVEALAKLVGKVEKRTQLEKKIDLSKCIEPNKQELKPHSKKQQQQQPAAKQAKPKAKVIEFNELLKQEGILSPVSNQGTRNNRPNPGNRKLNTGPRAFPQLGEEPSPQKPYVPRNSGNNENQGGDYQQRQQNRPPRQQGQGGQGSQGRGQNQQGQNQQGQNQQGQNQQGGQRQYNNNNQNRNNNNNNQNRGNNNNNNQNRGNNNQSGGNANNNVNTNMSAQQVQASTNWSG